MSTQTRTIEVHIDDMDGKTETPDVRETTFAVDGTAYVMDLSEKSRERLHRALEPFISKARPEGAVVGSNGGARRAPAKKAAAKKTTSSRRSRRKGPDPAKVRAWATENKIEVGTHGRIPQDVTDAYNAAQSGAAVAPPTPTAGAPDTKTVTTRTDPSKIKATKKATTRQTRKRTTAKKTTAPPNQGQASRQGASARNDDAGTEGVPADKE